MTEESKSGSGKFGPFRRSHLATQATVLLPVIVIAGLSAWSIGARGQSAQTAPPVLATVQNTSLLKPDPTAVAPSTKPGVTAAASIAPPAGVKISSQSWRRAGLGSNALFNFTVRNTNDYAIGDIEVACAFSRPDGSHLTDRKRIIPDAVVSQKSRKTFARVHVGFVNINAGKAKCALVSASRI